MVTRGSGWVTNGLLRGAGANAVRLFGSNMSGSDALSVITVSLCGGAIQICVRFRLI